jgi:hypothetical protein
MSTPTTGNRIPEHTARAMDGDLHPELKAAYGYVDRVLHTADIQSALGIPAWHGWALREAFLAGCSHAAALAQPEPEGVTDEELVNFRNRATADCCASRSNNGANLLSSDDLVACQAASLRAVLARCARPTIQPVPVSERLPGPEDWDGCGNCWWFRPATRDDFPFWWLGGGDNVSTHWLPHHALPTP